MVKKFILSLLVLCGIECFAQKVSGSIDGHDYVDLCLPSGLKWAASNVGAVRSEDYGDYFAWGEVAPKDEYTKDNSFTSGKSLEDLLSEGVIDEAGNLTSQYDAATQLWGQKWRMPSYSDFIELLENCVWQSTTLNGVQGYKVSSRVNDKWIFLPAAGGRNGLSSYDMITRGYYWSSSAYEIAGVSAYLLDIGVTNKHMGYRNRYYGRSVRAVTTAE
ncbi:MAG: hypothetical protein MJZ19_09080 [Paludibacteraceae bacterium]|nr:hypothetical protein [Paludibacteraceae bacterium]